MLPHDFPIGIVNYPCLSIFLPFDGNVESRVENRLNLVEWDYQPPTVGLSRFAAARSRRHVRNGC